MLHAVHLHRLDRLIWALIGAITLFVLVAAAAGGFTIVWQSFAAPAGCGAALLAGAWYYWRWRNDPKLATALGGTAQVIAFTAVGAPLSYIAASANFPLQDHLFAGIDRSLGLDWKALLGWMNAWSNIHVAFSLSYLSFTVQVIAIVLVLALADRLTQLRVFMLALIFSSSVCIAISALVPAEGVWGYFKLSQSDYPAIVPATRELHLSTFFGLRDGSYRLLSGLNSEGIITFPSFHAALGVIFMAIMWPIPVVRWISVAMNGLMIAATPIDGGHYFIDVLAGVGIAVFCIAAARRIAAGAAEPAHANASRPLQAAE
jgi:hypothetical protein